MRRPAAPKALAPPRGDSAQREGGDMTAAQRIAFVGGGNMAGALIEGLLKAGTAARDLLAVEINAARRAQLEQQFGIGTTAGADDGLRAYDVLVLAVKPQQMKEVCAALTPHIGRNLVVSIAAGIRARDLARWLGTEAIVRAMPNTPALIGQGVAGLAALAAVTAPQRALADRILAAVGRVVWFDDESALDAVTAISASGPAYIFYFILVGLHLAHIGLLLAAFFQRRILLLNGDGRMGKERNNILVHIRIHVLELLESFNFIDNQWILLFKISCLNTLFQVIHRTQMFFPCIVDDRQCDLSFHCIHQLTAMGIQSFLQVCQHIDRFFSISKRNNHIFYLPALGK